MLVQNPPTTEVCRWAILENVLAWFFSYLHSTQKCNLKSKQKHFEVASKSRKGAILRLFSLTKRLDRLNFTESPAKVSWTQAIAAPQSNFIFVRNYISYLCEILFYICPEITFCNLRCDNQANFPPQQYGLDKCHFDDEERLGFPDHPIDPDHITSRSLNDEFDTWNDKCYIIWPKSFDIFDIT